MRKTITDKDTCEELELRAGPIYQVIIKYPDWLSSGYLRDGVGDALTFSTLDSNASAFHEFSVHYFHDPESSSMYFAIQASSNQKWLSHNGVYTQRHSAAVLTDDNSSITNSKDLRLFYCVKDLCDHKGAVAQIPGTDLYLNGEMRRDMLLTFDRINYLTFLATHYARSQPNPTGHMGIDWALGRRLVLRYNRAHS